MGWLEGLIDRIAGESPTDWFLVDDLLDPGLDIAGKSMLPDQCYIELYVESLRLAKARRFTTAFNGLVYSFAELSRSGHDRIELASLTKPQNLADIDSKNLDRVITVSKRTMGAMPWRGGPLSLELGLFSVKSGNILGPLVDYVTKVSEKSGISAAVKLDPFLPLITEGLDIIIGQKQDTEIELAINSDINLTESRLCAIVALPKNELNESQLSIDRVDRKLLLNGKPLDAGYCVFSIRYSDRNPDWGAIEALKTAYADFNQAILSGKHKDAEEALAGFNRQVVVCPDLIDSDKERLRAKVKQALIDAFPGGGQSADITDIRKRFEGRSLSDLNLYDD